VRGGRSAVVGQRAGAAAAVALVLAVAGCTGPPPDSLAPCPSGPTGARGVELVSGLPAGDAARGAGVFEQHCARCHAPRVGDRESRLFGGYPRLDCDSWLATVSDARLATVVLRGGEPFGLDSAMKPFAGTLSRAEVADVVAFLRAGAGP